MQNHTGLIYNGCIILEPLDKLHRSCIDKFHVLCYCGNEFITCPRSLKKGNTKSCGCLSLKTSIINGHKKLQSDNYNKVHNNLIILEPVDINKRNGRTSDWIILCHCGIKFTSTPSEIYSNKIISCGCLRDKARSITFINYHKRLRKLKGVDENTYLSDVTLLMRECVFNPIKHIILEIDNHTCNLCFKEGYDLEVHHIEPINKNFNVLNIDTYTKIYDINNLITLCHDCHKYNAHFGHGKLINKEIQNTLKTITSMRFINSNVRSIYNNIVINTITPWIQNYITSL